MTSREETARTVGGGRAGTLECREDGYQSDNDNNTATKSQDEMAAESEPIHQRQNATTEEESKMAAATVAQPNNNLKTNDASFVNTGLLLWEQSRSAWLAHNAAGGGGSSSGNSSCCKAATPLEVDDIIDVIFTSPRQIRENAGLPPAFAQPVPLPQMVDILQDLWEAEGLDA